MRKFLTIYFWITIFILVQLVSAADEQRNEEDAKKLRKEYHNKSTGEKILDAPAQIIFFPLKLTLVGLKGTIEWAAR